MVTLKHSSSSKDVLLFGQFREGPVGKRLDKQAQASLLLLNNGRCEGLTRVRPGLLSAGPGELSEPHCQQIGV